MLLILIDFSDFPGLGGRTSLYIGVFIADTRQQIQECRFCEVSEAPQARGLREQSLINAQKTHLAIRARNGIG